jgi:hypothetical protein
MDEWPNRLPNLNPGHLAGCTTEAVYSGVKDTPPVLIVARCQEGCPHRSLELRRA